MTDLSWQDHALCAEVGGDIFFPAKGDSSAPAKRICAACPVVGACLSDALNMPEFEDRGIRGGMTHLERTGLRRGAA